MNINHHLLKTKPLYKDWAGRTVKLLCAYKSDDGLMFTTEIMDGEDKGKWGQVFKHELKKYNKRG